MKIVKLREDTDNIAYMDNVDRTKIYIIKYKHLYYKLHYINGSWMFCSLDDSESGTTGISYSFRDAIKDALSCGYEVLEFDNFNDFVDKYKNEQRN